MLLIRFTKLRHLVLDGCCMKRLDVADGEWVALGKNCALAGVRRAKEREKKLKAWLQADVARSAPFDGEQTLSHGQEGPRRPRRGRRGLATATISLRESSTRNSSVPTNIPSTATKIRILPPSPSLASLAITTSSQIPIERHGDIRADFERGWTEGLAQLTATRNRLRQSLQNGIKVVLFSDEADESEEGLNGLVDIESADEHSFGGAGKEHGRAPLLCLAGPGRKVGHVEGCGHAIGWNVWKDDL